MHRNRREFLKSFSPASRIILIESYQVSDMSIKRRLFQSRKQDYFNWKYEVIVSCSGQSFCFSPASRIILIERYEKSGWRFHVFAFQSRKQDYFNWKKENP